MIKKQRLAIIIGIPAAVILLCLYWFWLSPMLSGGDISEAPELVDGEVLGVNDRVQMFEHLEKAQIKSIEVHNEKGEFTFYRDTDGEFYIRGKEGAPYNPQTFAQLIVNAGYTLALERYTDVEDMSAYGLGAEDDPSYYIITSTAGREHKVYVGDPLVTGGGYYCSYDGRDGVVYVLDSSFAYTLLADLNSLISPTVVYPISSDDYYKTDDFYIVRAGETVVWIDYVSGDELGDSDSVGAYRMLAPAEYNVNVSNYGSILEALSSAAGEAVVEVGDAGELIDKAHLKEAYGIDMDSPAYAMGYLYSNIEITLLFSEKGEDGKAYVYSPVFNLVCTVDMADFDFLDWDIIKFVDTYVIYKNINTVREMRFEADGIDVTFRLDGADKELIVADSITRKAYTDEQISNFRQFYRVVLSMKMAGYTENEAEDEDRCILTMSIVTSDGDKSVYKFYAYSTRRCFYTVNGEGEFYTLRDGVDKVIEDLGRVLASEPVDADAHS